MAESKANQSQRSSGGTQAMTRTGRDGGELSRWRASDRELGDPIELFSRMSEEMDRTFERMWSEFAMPGQGLATRQRRSWLPRNLFGRRTEREPQSWAPRIEAVQKGDRFIVRAELPGLKKDDVQVEITEDALSIRGERRNEQQEERDGYFHSELSYGQFFRTIPLPEGTIGESAQATFNNGVLEISMQAPPAEANRGRRVEIKDASQ
jgi:HSP20 family protein